MWPGKYVKLDRSRQRVPSRGVSEESRLDNAGTGGGGGGAEVLPGRALLGVGAATLPLSRHAHASKVEEAGRGRQRARTAKTGAKRRDGAGSRDRQWPRAVSRSTLVHACRGWCGLVGLLRCRLRPLIGQAQHHLTATRHLLVWADRENRGSDVTGLNRSRANQ